jgi:hypothetical protein
MTTKAPPARLFVIRARKVPFAVVFRRGPSKQVRLIGWNTETDTFEGGQWLKGRIYERRCDLSPNGRYLIYCAAKHKLPIYAWTAISKPPWLTAISLWPNMGCWGGGGLFETANSIWLNHPPSARLAPGFEPRPRLTVKASGGGGEDHPIYGMRLKRDGWTLIQDGTHQHNSWRKRQAIGMSFTFDPPEIWERASVLDVSLRMVTHGLGEQDGDWYVVTYEIVTPGGETVSLGRTDWADWDGNGDLLYAKDGKMFRLSPGKGGRFDPAASREIADFNGDRFQAIPPPNEAKRW